MSNAKELREMIIETLVKLAHMHNELAELRCDERNVYAVIANGNAARNYYIRSERIKDGRIDI